MQHSESLEQRALIKWADLARAPCGGLIGDHLFAIPNGGSRRPIEAAIMKGEGVRAGVPDLFLAYPRGVLHGMFIEMKRQGKSSVSADQKKWIDRLSAAGYSAVVCRGCPAAVAAIEEYLRGE